MTRTRYGVAPWIDQLPKKRRREFPRYRGSSSSPVVIVGGGLAGCFTAYAFAASGVRVALIEADRLGAGGGGRGPGILRGEPTPSYREIETRHGRKAARALFDGSRRAVLDLATTARRLGVKDVETADAMRVLAAFGGDEKTLARDTDLRRAAGLDAVWKKAAKAAAESGVESARGGVSLRDWATANPYELIMAFAAAAADRGATLFERSAVRKIAVRSRSVEIQVQDGTIQAETVIVCTGEPTHLYASLKRHVRARQRYVVMTDRLPAPMRKLVTASVAVVTDAETPAHCIRWTGDGRVIVAGADDVRPPLRRRDTVLVQRTGQLMYELSRMYPAISGVMPSYGWDLPIARSADGVMYAGPHRNYPRHLFAWATGHDPGQAFLASRILLRHYLGQATRDDAYFAFTRG